MASLKNIGVEADTETLVEVSAGIKALRAAIPTLRAAMAHDHDGTAEEEAANLQGKYLPAMNAVHAAADGLEGLVADDVWPLATYQEMLFIL